MAHTRSAKKWMRKNKKRTLLNKSFKSMARTHIRHVMAAVAAGDAARAEEQMRAAFKRIDKCAKKNIFHPNKAARLKSRLSRTVRALRAGAQEG